MGKCQCDWIDPWSIGLVALKAIEFKVAEKRKVIWPSNLKVLAYLKRMHLPNILQEIGYQNQPTSPFLSANEDESPNLQELFHSLFRDNFQARLSSKIKVMFQTFGLNEEDQSVATALVGELGNNVFDHNEGAWPTDVRGAIVVGQHNPLHRQIEIVVADPGIGFLGSMQVAKPGLKSDIEAIEYGLSGVTGRVGESRGNGLRIVQGWAIDRFQGAVRIHSGEGLVVVDADGRRPRRVPRVTGTLASVMVKYQQETP